MGITKEQLVDTVTKVKGYVDNRARLGNIYRQEDVLWEGEYIFSISTTRKSLNETFSIGDVDISQYDEIDVYLFSGYSNPEVVRISKYITNSTCGEYQYTDEFWKEVRIQSNTGISNGTFATMFIIKKDSDSATQLGLNLESTSFGISIAQASVATKIYIQKIVGVKHVSPETGINVIRTEDVLFEGKESVPVTTSTVNIKTLIPLPDISQYNAFNVVFYEKSGDSYSCTIDTKQYAEDESLNYNNDYAKGVYFSNSSFNKTINAQLFVFPKDSGSWADLDDVEPQDAFCIWTIKGSKVSTLYVRRITGIKYCPSTSDNIANAGGGKTYTDEEIFTAVDEILNGGA